jgi:hypothetical protein
MRLPSDASLHRLAALATALVCAAIITVPVPDFDVHWHLANGREMLSQGRIVNEELFSYTHFGEEFSNHEWLAEILLYLVYKFAGAAGMVVADIGFGFAVVALLYLTGRALGARRDISALLATGALLAGFDRYNFRPEIFSLLFVALYGWILHGYRVGALPARHLAVLPVTLLLWDWLHGAPFGVVLLIVVTFSENLKSWLSRFSIAHRGFTPMQPGRLATFNRYMLVTLAVWIANPYGAVSYDVFLEFARNNALVQVVEEFRAPTWSTHPVFFVSVAIGALLFATRWRSLELSSVLCAAPFLFLALLHSRAVAVAALTMVPALAVLQPTVSGGQRVRTAGAWLARAGLGIATAAALAYLAEIRLVQPPGGIVTGVVPDEDYAPVGAVRFILANNVQGNLYNSGDVGGYLSYALYPARRIFQFNHHYVFGDTLRYVRRPEELRTWNIAYAVVSMAEEVKRLFPRAAWAPVYREPTMLLVLRRTPENAALIARYEIRYFSPLLSDDALFAIAGNPLARGRLVTEMKDYLRFRSDARICNALRQVRQQWYPGDDAMACE